MLKRTLKFAAFISASVLLVACGGMNGAQAQTIDATFTVAGGAVNVASVGSVSRAGNYTVLQSGDSEPVKIDDGSLILYHKLTGDAWFAANFIGYSTNWFNLNHIVQSRCVANRTLLTLANNPTQIALSDNCFVSTAIRSRAK
jgi:hypothetical protein